jgi:hypothetical protein
MPMRATPPEPEAGPDEAPPTQRTGPPVAVLTAMERTSKEPCKRCGGQATARCVGCGEAFCKTCVDPISTRAPDVRCRKCMLRIAEGSSQGTPLLLEQVLAQCFAYLSAAPPSPFVNLTREEALDCQAEIDSWRASLPAPEVRGAMRERVLALHAKIADRAR